MTRAGVPLRSKTPARPRPARRGGSEPVWLISMPFGPLFWPSLGLSLLQAGLARDGVRSRIRYFTLDFAGRIGEATYSTIAMTGRLSVADMAGEWIFSGDLFPQTPAAVRRYVREVLVRRAGSQGGRPPVPGALVERILRARGRVDAFLDRCVDELAAARPRVVGFTSVFQQHVASLALARRLKQALPDAFVVFGGANCEGVMGAETLRRFPFVDAVVSGEGDVVFPELVRRVGAGMTVSGLPGVRTSDRLGDEFALGRFPNAPAVRAMDDLPYPDYGDYFAQYRRSRLARDWKPSVLVETSRGCWWGERSHCTFCGLNGASLAYRSKSADRALAEMEWLAERHRGAQVQVVDNILDLDYFRTLLPRLAERRLDFSLFYETKSNLKKDQVRLLRDAGVRHIQPGVESFSDAVLKLMRKGVSSLHNVQLLKWCKQYGVAPLWNLLWGFPGEPPEDYTRMAALVPRLTHLPAPVGVFGLRLDRFSPNHDQADALGFAEVRPLPAYRSIYRLPDEALANLAYYFTYRYREPREPRRYTAPLLREIARWRRVQAHCDLFSIDVGGRLLIWDLRAGRAPALTVLDGPERALYLAFDGVTELGRARAAIGGAGDAADDARRLERLVSGGLMLQDGTRYLSLAIPLGEYAPGAAVVKRFHTAVSKMGRRTSAGFVVPLNGGGAVPRDIGNGRSIPRGRDPGTGGRRRTLDPGRFGLDGHGNLVVR